MKTTPQYLWATAGIARLIRKFYSQPDTHNPVGPEFAPGLLSVLRSSGTPIEGVQVRKAGPRYRFENRASESKPICYTANPSPSRT
jgi:hypothetical protein